MMNVQRSVGPEGEATEKTTSILQPPMPEIYGVSQGQMSGAIPGCTGDACGGVRQPWETHGKTLQPMYPREGMPVSHDKAPWDDARAFLGSFEEVAQACQWPKREWAARLRPALSGEAQRVYSALDVRDQEDYEEVKAAILRGDALRLERQRQLFRQFSCQKVDDPRRIHHHLQELCHRWLRPERRSKEQIVELLILEQFLASLPPDLQGWIWAGAPDSCSQAVALVEDFLKPLKEEPLDSLQGVEEPRETVKKEIHQEVKQNDDETHYEGVKVQRPCSTFPPEGSGPGKAEPMETNLTEEDSGTLQAVEQRPAQPGVWAMSWQSLQQKDGSAIALGNWNSPPGQMPPEVMPGEAKPNGPRTITVKCEMGAESIVSDEQRAVRQSGRKEGGRLTESPTSAAHPSLAGQTRENLPLFSKYGRRYHYVSESPGNEGLRERRVKQEASRLSSHRGEPQSPSAGERGPASTKCWKGHPTRPLRGSQAQERRKNSQGSQQGSETPRWSLRSSPGAPQGPYPCAHCGKSYQVKKNLKKHEKIHNAEKPFVCPECQKGFVWKSDLLRHRERHLTKHFQCSDCGKFFSRKDTLTRHRKSHVGQSPSSRRRSSAKDERKRLQSRRT